MNTPYDTAYTPPVPILQVELAAPGESPRIGPLPAVVDTGSDGTLVPTDYLERAEAIGLDEAILHGIAGGSRRVHLFEIDLHIGPLLLPGVIVAGDDDGNEVLLGRNVLNKLIVLLDGPRRETELFEQRPNWR
jgi:hypothetical protein